MEVSELCIANYVLQIEATNLDKLQAYYSWAKLTTLHEFYPTSLINSALQDLKC